MAALFFLPASLIQVRKHKEETSYPKFSKSCLFYSQSQCRRSQCQAPTPSSSLRKSGQVRKDRTGSAPWGPSRLEPSSSTPTPWCNCTTRTRERLTHPEAQRSSRRGWSWESGQAAAWGSGVAQGGCLRACHHHYHPGEALEGR
jgi:hypothetical protein